MLLCPIYCSAIAFNPASLQRHVGKAMVCKLAHFPPTMDLFLAAGWQDRGHIHVLVCIPQTLLLWQQGWIYHSRSFLSLDGGLDGHVSPLCTSLPSSLRGTANLTLHFSSSHIFSRLLSFQLYACKGGSTSISPACTTLLFAC